MIQPFRTRSAVQADVVLWAKRIHMATHKANKKAVNEHSDLRFAWVTSLLFLSRQVKHADPIGLGFGKLWIGCSGRGDEVHRWAQRGLPMFAGYSAERCHGCIGRPTWRGRPGQPRRAGSAAAANAAGPKYETLPWHWRLWVLIGRPQL